MVDDLARNVGAGRDKQAWWKKDFLLNDWGEKTFVARVQSVGAAGAKRRRTAPLTVDVGCDHDEDIQKIKFTDNEALPALHPPERLADDGHVLPTLSAFTKVVADAAAKCGRAAARYMPRIPKNDPDKIELCRQRLVAHSTPDNLQRTRAYKAIAKLVRRIRGREVSKRVEYRAQLGQPLPRPRRRLVVPHFVDADGNKQGDRGEMKNILTKHFEQQWHDHDELRGQVPNWIWNRWNASVLDPFPEINGGLLRMVSLRMGKGKTCSDDRVVMEMLQDLDELVLDELAEIFKLRALNHVSGYSDRVWDEYLVCLIGKKVAPRAPSQMRPIAILACISKLFFAVLLHIIGDTVIPISPFQFAFREKHQAAECVFIIKQLIEKSIEWNMPFCFLDGDLPKAYDNMLHPVIAERLTKRGFPKFFTSAVLRETRRQKVRIVMGDIVTDVIRRTKSLCQGSSDAPRIFNHVFDEDICDFVKTCKRRKWGFPIGCDVDGHYNDFLPIIVFADNFWLISKSPQELQMMANIWFSRCSYAGWNIPHSECCWATTLTDRECTWKLVVEGNIIERRSRDDGVKVLGCVISCDGRMDIELSLRITAAWNAFYTHRDTLQCSSVPMAKRLKLLQCVVEPSLFWCAGTWKLSVNQSSNLRGVQREMIRKMMQPKIRKGELLPDFYPRVQTCISRCMEKHGYMSWDLKARDFYFKWAGQVARMTQLDPNRLSPRVLHFKNIRFILDYAKRHDGCQGHGRNLHVWRWESDIFSYGSSEDREWETMAMDLSKWFSVHLDNFRYAKVVRDGLKGHKRLRLS